MRHLQIRSEGRSLPAGISGICIEEEISVFCFLRAYSRGLAPPQPTLHLGAPVTVPECTHPFSVSTAPAFLHWFTPASRCWAPGAHKSVLSKRPLSKFFCLLVCFEQMRNSGVEVTESQIAAQMEHLSNIQRPTCNSFQHQSRMLASFNQPFLCWSATRDS